MIRARRLAGILAAAIALALVPLVGSQPTALGQAFTPIELTFNGVQPGQEPSDWLDTAANNSLNTNASLFRVEAVAGDPALMTSSNQTNIHSHYVAPGSETLSDYRLSGSMRITDPAGGTGITFYSDYPNSDTYYRLRRYGNGGTFHLSPHGTNMTAGVVNTSVVPLTNTWYQFVIEVETRPGEVAIRAKVWQQGATEPANWQIDAADSSATRIDHGTIGVWGYLGGSKYWDNLRVEPLPAPEYEITIATSGNGSVLVDPLQDTYSEGEVVTVTAQPASGWKFAGWSGDVSGASNPVHLTVDADVLATATFTEQLPPVTLDLSVLGQGSLSASPNLLEHQVGQVVTVTAEADPGWRLDSWLSVPPISSSAWWDDSWSHRLPLSIPGGATPQSDVLVETDVDLTTALAALGESITVDADSFRVVETNQAGLVVNPSVPFQFTPAAGFDGSTNAAGSLLIYAEGELSAGSSRLFHLYFADAASQVPPAVVPPLVTVSDNIPDAGLTTLRFVTPGGTYYYDKNGGGFSSFVDSSGNDWISYSSAFGAAGTYRGIPNMVYPGGQMHPGNGGVTTTLLESGPLRAMFRSSTPGGTWVTEWSIFPSHAEMTVTAAAHSYWVLYEGTPGGTLQPATDIVVRSGGQQTLANQAWTGDLPEQEWAYFGDPAAKRSLFMASHQQDSHIDSYYAMEGKMTVFGFGRNGLNRYLNQVPARFSFGLVESTAYPAVSSTVGSILEPLAVQVGRAESSGSGAPGTSLVFAIQGDQQITATFVEALPLSVTAAVAGSGSVSAEPAGPQYLFGETVELTATADPGWYFVGWSGDVVSSTNPLSFEVTDDVAVTANFSNAPVALDIIIEGQGSVIRNPNGSAYPHGTVVTITAVPDAGWEFVGWEGDVLGSQNPATVNLTTARDVTALFEQLNTSAPTIEVWYGDIQTFGAVGIPQPWYNVLGNVTDPDGVASLTYTLNGGPPQALSLGTDNRRLAAAGDFNIDLAESELVTGPNQVLITAIDSLGNPREYEVEVVYDPASTWPTEYTTDWSATSSIGDVVQVVDGEWQVTPGGARTVDPDYDRLLAIGDTDWTDYEVRVPFTLHSVDPEGFQSGESGGAGIGVIMRWNGHTDWPVPGWQPKTGWIPYGAIGWYWWTSPGGGSLQILGNNSVMLASENQAPPAPGNYELRMRVESVPGAGARYYLKFWPAGQPEPAAWDLIGQAAINDPASGSLLLVAHHVDVTFGTVEVAPSLPSTGTVDVSVSGSGSVNLNPTGPDYPLGSTVSLAAVPANGWVFAGWSGALSGLGNPAQLLVSADHDVVATFAPVSQPPVISSVVVSPTAMGATITWTTDQPATSAVSYGLTPGLELGTISSAGTTTSHSIQVPGLSPLTTYFYRVSSTGPGGQSSTATATFTTLEADPLAFFSDDFNACVVDQELWTFVNPLAVGSATLTGRELHISVPGGTAHDVWTGGNMAPRLMQPALDTDFEIEVKFDSVVANTYQMQGVLVEESPGNFLRLDFYGQGSQTYAFAAGFANGTPTAIANVLIGSPTAPLWMRVQRVGDSWVQSVSDDGSDWTAISSFTRELNVSSVGVFAGNTGGNPAHTAVVDYFFNTAAPVFPEDANAGATLTATATSGGEVTVSPEQDTYFCGETVTLTAVPDAGWAFSGWSGDLTGQLNPAVFSVEANSTVVANFVEIPPPAITSVQVTPLTTGAIISWSTDIPSTRSVAYGETPSHEMGVVSNGALTTNHIITLVGLTPATDYHYAISSASAGGTTTLPDAVFSTLAVASGPFVSDDFNTCSVNSGLWTFIDPVGDGEFTVNGTQLEILAAGGTSHDVWVGGNMAPRLMQPAQDVDFTLEVKFESALWSAYEMQGILIEESPGTFLRFDFYSNWGQVYIFAARFTNGVPTVIANVPISSPVGASYMRISRVGDTWQQSYSYNGTSWTAAASFTHALTVGSVGVFAGNTGMNPEHTAIIDYFFNTAAPIVPEDALPAYC